MHAYKVKKYVPIYFRVVSNLDIEVSKKIVFSKYILLEDYLKKKVSERFGGFLLKKIPFESHYCGFLWLLCWLFEHLCIHTAFDTKTNIHWEGGGGCKLHETPCIVILLPSGIGYVTSVCHLTCISVQCWHCTHTAGLGI